MYVSRSTMSVHPKLVDGKIRFISEVIDYARDGTRIGEPQVKDVTLYSMGWSDSSHVTQRDLDKLEG